MATLTLEPMTMDMSALPQLTGNVRAALDWFLGLLNAEVQRNAIPFQSIEVRGTTDPEDGTSQVLVRLWVHEMSEAETRQFYCEFGSIVDQQIQTLSPVLREALAATISFQARRVSDANSL